MLSVRVVLVFLSAHEAELTFLPLLMLYLPLVNEI